MENTKVQFKTLKYNFKPTKSEANLLGFLCHISKNIYNSALYELRQQFFKTKSICTYFDLNKILKDNENFHILNTYMSLCTIRQAHNNMSKFVYHNNKSCCKLPRYLKKQSYFNMITDQVRPLLISGKKYIKLPLSNLTRTSKVFNKTFEDELISLFIKESELKTSLDIYLPIPKELYTKKIHQVRIVPKYNARYFSIEFSYETESIDVSYQGSATMGVDLGISNLATCITESGDSFIIDGKRLKSINQLYNKKIADAQAKLPKKVFKSKHIERLRFRRENAIEDYLNKAVNTLLNKAIELNISEIILGWNKGIKTGGIKPKIKVKNKTKGRINQSFVGIPLARFKNKLIYKAEELGIKVIVINESYTSKSSALDNDPVEKCEYSGQRINRGLYKTKDNLIINADSNAALNMIRKYRSNSKEIDISLMSRGLTSPNRVQVSL